MRGRIVFLHFLGLTGLLFGVVLGGSEARTLVLEGSEQSYFVQSGVLPGGIVLPQYRNFGFEQTSTSYGDQAVDRLISVRVSLEPIFEQVSFKKPSWLTSAEVDPASVPGPFDATLQELIKEKRSMAEVVNAVFTWVHRSMTLTQTSETPRDALTIFRRRQGNCVDISTVTHELLTRLGIQSRIVHGIMYKKHSGSRESETQAEFHRWLEVNLPPVGWVFYDPTASCAFVRSGYIVLYIEDSDILFPEYMRRAELLDIPSHLSLMRTEDKVQVTDCLIDGETVFLTRRFSMEQNTSAIYGQVTFMDGTPLKSGAIVVEKQDSIRVSFPINAQGVYSAYCLGPGLYTCTLDLNGTLIPTQKVLIEQAEVKKLDLVITQKIK
ncbi:transglutaminase domain-containing protein [bacterium]|nr:transglutaminase domain-containing protein [bacterium]